MRGVGRLRLQAAVVAIVAVIAGVVGVSAPASAAGAHSPDLAGAIDCTSLQSGYYHSIHVTGTFTGLPASAQLTGDVLPMNTESKNPFGATVDSDAQGAATLDLTVSGQFVAQGLTSVELYSGTTRVYFGSFYANACAAGVALTGRLTADAVCPTRYIAFGSEQASTLRIHGTLSGLAPSTTYTFGEGYYSAQPWTTAVSDASGSLQLDFTSGPLPGYYNVTVWTTSQAWEVAAAPLDMANPCPAMHTKWFNRPAESDINGDGMSDLLAIDFTGRLLYYQNAEWANPGGVPFTMSQTIGSGWGPQFGLRMESAGDLTGDGYSELVAVRSDGTLVAYYNNMNSNPGRVPYTSGTVIGSGWQPFTSITLGDVNGDGLADLIARKSDGSVVLYLNHFFSNPGHMPFSSGVSMTIPGLATTDAFVAADLNKDGYSDVVDYSGWASLNRAPAGSPQMFIDAKDSQATILASLGQYIPTAGWAAGFYYGSGVDTGVLIANPNGDGTLLELEGAMGQMTLRRVIGGGWQSIRQIIS